MMPAKDARSTDAKITGLGIPQDEQDGVAHDGNMPAMSPQPDDAHPVDRVRERVVEADGMNAKMGVGVAELSVKACVESDAIDGMTVKMGVEGAELSVNDDVRGLLEPDGERHHAVRERLERGGEHDLPEGERHLLVGDHADPDLERHDRRALAPRRKHDLYLERVRRARGAMEADPLPPSGADLGELAAAARRLPLLWLRLLDLAVMAQNPGRRPLDEKQQATYHAREWITGVLEVELRSMWGAKEWKSKAEAIARWVVAGCPWPPPRPPSAAQWFLRRAVAAGLPLKHANLRAYLGGDVLLGGYEAPCLGCGITLHIPPAINCSRCDHEERPEHYFHLVCRNCRKLDRVRAVSLLSIEQPALTEAPQLPTRHVGGDGSAQDATRSACSATDVREPQGYSRGPESEGPSEYGTRTNVDTGAGRTAKSGSGHALTRAGSETLNRGPSGPANGHADGSSASLDGASGANRGDLLVSHSLPDLAREGANP